MLHPYYNYYIAMKNIYSILMLFCSCYSPLTSTYPRKTDLSDILKPGAELIKLAGDFRFTEGPAADKAGNVYFTDQPNDRIMIWSTGGELSTFMQPSGRSNGMFFDRQGITSGRVPMKKMRFGKLPRKRSGSNSLKV